MTIKNKMISACLMCLVVFSVVGCSPKDGEKSNNFISTQNMELIYEETISPNKEYVEKEEDIVNYTVEVYQDDDHMIFLLLITSPSSEIDTYTIANKSSFVGVGFPMIVTQSQTISTLVVYTPV